MIKGVGNAHSLMACCTFGFCLACMLFVKSKRPPKRAAALLWIILFKD